MPEFDPSQPFVEIDEAAPPFDPDAPFVEAEGPESATASGLPQEFDPTQSFEEAPEDTPSLQSVVPFPGEAQPAAQPRAPQNRLELQQQDIQQERSRLAEIESQVRPDPFTPEERQRIETRGIAETLTSAHPALEAPIVTGEDVLKRFPTMTEGNAKIMAGVIQTAAGVWNFAASPFGAVTMPTAGMAALPGTAGLVGKSVLGGFAAEAVLHEGEAINALDQAVRSGDPERIAQTATQLALNTFVAVGASRGTLKAAEGMAKTDAAATAIRAREVGLEQSARALEQATREGPIQRPSPEATARESLRPSPEAISLPESLRRQTEVQLAEAPTLEAVGVAGPSRALPREIKMEVDAGVTKALEQYQLAKQRQSEKAAREKGGKLDVSEETFSGLEKTPGFLETAEQRITKRPTPSEPPSPPPPEITARTPLKDVEQIVRKRLEQRDWANAVATLGQTKAETSAKIVNKLLGVGRESVPLNAAERTIFNEIWDQSLRKAGAPQGVRPEPPDLVRRLESLRTPLTPGVGANPFPEIAKAVWNTSLDIAIAGVKAGQHIKIAIDSAVSHLRRNASGFDEAKVREYLDSILLRETSPVVERAEKAVDAAKQQISIPATKEESIRLGDPYSEPIVERVGRIGKGPVSKAVTQESLQIVDTAKRIIGELSTTVLDDAKRAAGSMTGGTAWMNGIENITPRAAVGRFHNTLETRSKTGNFGHVPAPIRPLAEKLWTANLEIGKLAEKASPNFKATGEAQRMLTAYGMDVVRRGGGKAWQAWVEGLSKANDIPIEKVKSFLKRWKSEMDQPGWDSAHLDRIAQDFKRQFPNVVTHVKPFMGWHEVVHSSPFRYLEQASQRTAHSVAFRQVYPLIRDAETGKWHGSGKLESTRKAVMAELETDAHGAEFDNLMRALQGHPIDTYVRSWSAPDTPIGASVRSLNDAAQPLFSAMLSATSFRNIGESLSGGAQIFMGYRRAFEAAISERRAYSDLERSGMVNRAILDFSFDPTAPVRSVSKQSSNLIRRAFAEQISNEFQEFTGAAAARVIAREIRENRLPPGDRERVVSVMRSMGIAYKDAVDGAAGRNEAAISQFETKAAEFLFGGNRAIAESSPLGANRAFTALFKWHSYPMTKMRQTRSIVSNILESAQKKDAAQVWDNSKLLGKHLGGTALGGAMTTGVMALIYEGLYGSGIKQREAQQDFPEFLKDSYIMAMGGPVQVAAKMMEEGGDVSSWVAQLVNASAPIGVANDFSRMVLGLGAYEGTTPFERIGQFVESKTPFSRAIRRGMAAFGLAQENTELDASIRAFRRWRKDKFGFTKFESHFVDDYDNAAFRGRMKKAVTALQRGNIEEYNTEIDKALDLEDSTEKKVRQSLRGRRILSRPHGEKLTDEDDEELRKILGDKGMEILEDFDAMLKTL